jgi:hypothetical protein
MMRRALTDYGRAVSYLSTLVPKLAATAAAAGDPYPLLVLEASKRHPKPAGPSDAHGPQLPDRRAQRLWNGPRTARPQLSPTLSSQT